MKTVRHKVDLLVVGAGMAGILAGLAAAREGLRVMIVDRSYNPGGQATSILNSEMGGYSYRGVKLYGGIEDEIVNQLIKVGAGKHYSNDHLSAYPILRGDNFRYNPEILKILLDWFIENATGITAVGGCVLTRAQETDDGVSAVVVGGEETHEIAAAVAIDATGAAALTEIAGFPTYRSLAERESATLMFRLSGTDTERVERFNLSSDLKEVVREGFEAGVLPSRYISLAPVPGTTDVSVNATRVHVETDSPEDFTRGMISARTQILRMIPFLKERVPGFAGAALASIGQTLGIRDGRRILGRVELVRADILKGRTFSDAVAVGCFPMGFHNVVTDETEWRDTGGVFGIPYACMLPKGAHRILAAGKCIGCDPMAATSIRSIPAVMNTGEAAGYAAALAVRQKKAMDAISIAELQQILQDRGLRVQ